jgi:hypothetical protein
MAMEDGGEPVEGDCHLNPPSRFVDMPKIHESRWDFPTTNEDDWCAQWRTDGSEVKP